MKMQLNLVVFCFWSIIFMSCNATSPPKKKSELIGQEIWTATNLQISNNQYIRWQNYHSGTLMPIATAVRLTEIRDHYAVLVDNFNKNFVVYWKQEKDKEKTFKNEFHKFFSKESPVVLLKKLPEEEVKAIRLGHVKPGMSKQTVLLSWGYPPKIEKPLTKNIWIYWVSDWKKKAVHFEEGVVSEIVYSE